MIPPPLLEKNRRGLSRHSERICDLRFQAEQTLNSVAHRFSQCCRFIVRVRIDQDRDGGLPVSGAHGAEYRLIVVQMSRAVIADVDVEDGMAGGMFGSLLGKVKDTQVINAAEYKM